MTEKQLDLSILEDYDIYLCTPRMKNLYKKYRKHGSIFVCYVCKTKRDSKIKFYHHNYKRLQKEHVEDFIPLCRNCDSFARYLYKENPSWRNKGFWKGIREAKDYYIRVLDKLGTNPDGKQKEK